MSVDTPTLSTCTVQALAVAVAAATVAVCNSAKQAFCCKTPASYQDFARIAALQ
jgi:hypothetical protein